MSQKSSNTTTKTYMAKSFKQAYYNWQDQPDREAHLHIISNDHNYNT